jgi:hypothetical protein
MQIYIWLIRQKQNGVLCGAGQVGRRRKDWENSVKLMNLTTQLPDNCDKEQLQRNPGWGIRLTRGDFGQCIQEPYR